MTPEDKQKQLHLTLDEKIKRSKELILEWYFQFELMKQNYPKIYEYCMTKLKMKEVLDVINKNPS